MFKSLYKSVWVLGSLSQCVALYFGSYYSLLEEDIAIKRDQ